MSPRFVFIPVFIFLLCMEVMHAQEIEALEAEAERPGWSLNARMLIGMSFPRIKSSGRVSQGSTPSTTNVPGYSNSPNSGSGDGWDADNMTWAYLIDATLHSRVVGRFHLGATMGFDRLGRTWGLHTRLYGYYLKIGPQLSLIDDEANTIYAGVNVGVPLSVTLSDEEGRTTFTSDSTTWNPLLELQAGLRMFPFSLFSGRITFNIDLTYGLEPMYSYDNGRSYNTMFALRTGFAYFRGL